VFTDWLASIPVLQKVLGPLISPQSAVKETKERNNGATLLEGHHIAMNLSKPATTIASIPSAVIKKQTTVDSSSVVYGATYECEGDSPAVNVTATGRAVFVGCHFSKEANTQSTTGSYINVEDGGLLSVIGCYFHNTQTAGFTINNAGLAANAVATGNIRETTAAVGHNNVTVGVEVVI
jgi:hypothetical protein